MSFCQTLVTALLLGNTSCGSEPLRRRKGSRTVCDCRMTRRIEPNKFVTAPHARLAQCEGLLAASWGHMQAPCCYSRGLRQLPAGCRKPSSSKLVGDLDRRYLLQRRRRGVGSNTLLLLGAGLRELQVNRGTGKANLTKKAPTAVTMKDELP